MSFSRRLSRLGGAPAEFKLSMSRQDLGDYLGLALETVSRLLSRFHDEGLIEVHGRQIILRDLNRLRNMAAGNGREHNVSAQ
jgi:CRP/FNR family transcriptional regulator